MIDCPSCGAQHKPGTLFCISCGEYLGADNPMTTELLHPDDPVKAPEASASSSVDDVADDASVIPIGIEIVASGRHAQLTVVSEVLIGRSDPVHSIVPGLNLAPDGGLEGGVSRRHCKIHRQRGVYLVEDVGSANGTYLNGQRLTAYLPRVLKNGDELQLGSMLLRITINENTPAA